MLMKIYFSFVLTQDTSKTYVSGETILNKSHKGYSYMGARTYEFYLRVIFLSLTSERSKRVRNVQHEKIKFVSPSVHVIFCVIYNYR
jgi:hypothetical protein